MIIDSLKNAALYTQVHDRFNQAFMFLQAGHVATLTLGRHEIDGDNVYAIMVEGEQKGPDAVKYEGHRKYIDIHFTVSGTDVIGWKDVSMCIPEGSFNEKDDYTFFTDKVVNWVEVPSGSFAVFFPHDAHAPMGGSGKVRKVVIKVAVE
ncbi:YhcH/YjgK/YiaL family protein [Candidatus Woesearchaeota archaeon]|nr:YhcH/YjgK/YiaL family protein [Candidatus Woesearchaeota archaeon]